MLRPCARGAGPDSDTQARVLVGGLFFAADHEGHGLRGADHLHIGGNHLDLAGVHPRILHPGWSQLHRAVDLQYPFKPYAFNHFDEPRGQIGMDRDLDKSVAVTQIEEDHSTVIAATVDPSGHGHLLSGVDRSEFTTRVCPMHTCLHVDCCNGLHFATSVLANRPRMWACCHPKRLSYKNNRPSQFALGDCIGRDRLRQMAVLRPAAVSSPSFTLLELRAARSNMAASIAQLRPVIARAPNVARGCRMAGNDPGRPNGGGIVARQTLILLAASRMPHEDHKERRMKLRTLFALDAALFTLFALGFLLGPATMLKFLGLTQGKTEVLMAQILGAALIGFAALAWFGRQSVDSLGSSGHAGRLDQLHRHRVRCDAAWRDGASDSRGRCLGARGAIPAIGRGVCVLPIRRSARSNLSLSEDYLTCRTRENPAHAW